ncbi:hypothetical protein M404DRAFT_34022 [Pisolithus tinctorius Marx 270]|uniref:Uncharacterized protein n=1 Tax=Pisolithus tinctorius Marx 270 TaxID=870435 RepID=A0A0C3NIP5_PISTI|nr:hypothetical protein M404DRAFT_34022 [Pisolithus tinctorius Marx 270]
METEEVDDKWEAGGEDEEELETLLKGPLGVTSWWTEWEWEWKLQAVERGWKRPQSEVAEDRNEEADEGVEGDNKEEVKGEQEGGEEQEGGREQAMEE